MDRRGHLRLFTDIVNSTVRAAELGDEAWTALLEEHFRILRSLVARYRGDKTTGDGIVATFDGPGRAVRCALAAVESVKEINLEIRAGCRTGEIQMTDADVAGVAVHAAARVTDLAGPGEVLTTRTVKELVAGGGLMFDDRGIHGLRGAPGDWPLFAARSD